MSYTDVFGGSTVQASDVQFRAVALSASIVTVWPAFDTTGNVCARIMKVTPSVGSLSVTLPDARLTSAGMDVLFDNPSATSFDVLDSAGGVVCTVAGGAVKYLYLSDNSTAAGTWRVTLFGVGASAPDAGQLAGYGLKAMSSTLNLAPPVTEISSNTTVTLADRAKVFIWTGGSGTLTLPSTAASTSDFAIEVHNQGSGTLTIATTGGVVIDGSSTISLIVTESCIIHMGSTDWYTVGRGRSTQFNFTQLNKVVTGGTVNLTLTEASNVVQTYTGALLSNQTVNQPAVVQVYYVNNSTTGAYTLTFGCVAGGTTVTVMQGQSAILFCDGTNVINANTSLAGGITSIVFGSGSAALPSAAFATANTGFYSTGSNEIGVANNGVYSGKFTTGGYKAELAGATAVQAISSGSSASIVADRPAGSVGSLRMRTASVDRWSLDANTTAESGSNAGSNLVLNAYNDAGTLLGSALSVARSTQIATFTQPPVLSGASITGVPISTGVSGLGTDVATALGVNVGTAGSPVVNGGVLGTPSSGTVTNLTGTASININGTVGATTPTTGSFTTVTTSGSVGIGGAPVAGYTLLNYANYSGSTTYYATATQGTIQSGVTTAAAGYRSALNTVAAAFTLPTLNHFLAEQGTIGATSVVTNQIGFQAAASLTGATNNYGFYSNIASTANRYNFYAAGSADNYFAGAVTGSGTWRRGQGYATSQTVGGVSNQGYQQFGGGEAAMVLARADNNANGTALRLLKTRNTTPGSFTTVLTGDSIGGMRGYADNGASYNSEVASIIFNVEGTVSTTATPGNIVFATAAAGNVVTTNRMWLDSIGSLGIGGAASAGITVDVTKAQTGATSAFTFSAQMNPDATVTAVSYGLATYALNGVGTSTTSFVHLYANQGTFSGTAPTNQYGFSASSSLTGATNNYGFYSNIASGTNRYNFCAAGTAQNYLGGILTITSSQNYAAANFIVNGSPSMNTSAIMGIANNVTLVGGASTTQYRAFSNETMYTPAVIGGTGFGLLNTTQHNNANPVATHYQNYSRTDLSSAQLGGTISTIVQYGAISPIFHASATTNVTTYHGFKADNVVQGAAQTVTNIYGFYSNQTAGTNRYNFYAAGTADNYFAGAVGIGGAPYAGINLLLNKSITGSATVSDQCGTAATILSDVTGRAGGFSTYLSTQAASFTLANLRHYSAAQNTVGAGSTITNQFGFFADSSLTGATNNYGFYSNITSAANRYNFYAAGSAPNYFAGVTGIGVAAASTSNLTVAASTTAVSSLNIPHGTAPSSPVNGDLWTTTAGAYVRINGATQLLSITVAGAQFPVTVVSGTTQAATAYNHYVLTNVSASTVTLPATPSSGDTVWVTWTNTLTTNVIARNGETIMGVSEDLTLDTIENGTIQLRFLNSSWRVL